MTTLKADSQRRVVLPDAEPGQVFAYENVREGQFLLTAVEAVGATRPTCSASEEDGFTVAVPNQPINEKAIEDLLADFP